MENTLLNYNFGLPENRINAPVLFKKFVTQNQTISSGLLIFDDGEMFILIFNKEHNKHVWKKFTSLKPEGIEKLKMIIENDFLPIDNNEWQGLSSKNILLWEANLNNKKKQVKMGSASYSALPPAFKKIEETINRYMVKLADQKHS